MSTLPFVWAAPILRAASVLDFCRLPIPRRDAPTYTPSDSPLAEVTSIIRVALQRLALVLPASLTGIRDAGYRNRTYGYLAVLSDPRRQPHAMSAILAAAGLFASAVLLSQTSRAQRQHAAAMSGAVLCIRVRQAPQADTIYRLSFGSFKASRDSCAVASPSDSSCALPRHARASVTASYVGVLPCTFCAARPKPPSSTWLATSTSRRCGRST